MIGEMIKGFRITGRLGEGGMGEVWAAEQQIVETKVAIKFLHAQLSKDQQFVQRFFNEARAVSMIKHAGIVKIHDVGFHDGSAFLIMELLEGESLASRLERVGRLPIAQIADIGRQITSVLGATHAVGITHRDLKPDNVFLVPDAELASGERVKVLDFGIAKLGGTPAVTTTGASMGTPGYMAPEQWHDAAKADAAADVYAVGCMVFEMCCGQLPFVTTTFAEAYTKHAFEVPPRASTRNPDVPAMLDDMIAAALAKQPAERPPMKVLQQVFAELGGVPPGAALPTGQYAAASQSLPQSSRAWTPQGATQPGHGNAAAPAWPQGTPLQPSAPGHGNANPPVWHQHQPQLPPPMPPPMPPGHASGTPMPPVAPTMPIRPPATRSSRALWIVLLVVVLAGGGIAAAVVTMGSPGGQDPDRPPAGDPAVRLAAASKALAGFGDPAPPASCAVEAAAQAAELAVAARQAVAGDPDGAIAAADESLRACANAAAHNARGNALLKTAKLAEAEAAYRGALEIAPDYGAPRSNLGIVQLRRRDPAAIATFNEILRRTPDDADAYKARAQAHAYAQHFAEAAVDLEEGLRRKPDDGRAWLLLGQLREKASRGDPQEAYCKAKALGETAAATLCKQ